MSPDQLSDAGLQGVRDSEALRLYAYPDPASPLHKAAPGQPWGFKPAQEILNNLPVAVQIKSGKPWTLAYGMTEHTDGRPILSRDSCTREEAEAWLRIIVAPYERAVAESVQIPLNQPMFDALTNMAYNIGAHAFRTSTLVRRLNAGQIIEAQAQFDEWVNAQGARNNGLVKRRNLEQAWFNEGILALPLDPATRASFEKLVREMDR